MRSGIVRQLPATMIGVAVIAAAAAIAPGHVAVADPDQDQRFFDLLGQKDIPPIDNANSLITSARHACEKLDGGMPVGDLVEIVRTNGFNENPLTRLQPQDRITRTIDQFINAAVEVYCPYNKGKIASIAAYAVVRSRVELVSLSEPIPAGEINPTKPLPVPAQPPPPVPQEIPPVPQQPPPSPPRHAPPVPKQAPSPPPEEPPPPAEAPQAPPEAAPPAPAAPGGGGNAPVPGAPGGGVGGGSTPATPTPEQPSPPGHIRLAP
jgi:hypothetical protein